MLEALFPAAVVVVDGIDPFDVPGDVDHGVPGDGHDGGLLVRHVVAGQEDGVRVSSAAGVPAQDENRIIVRALALSVAAPGADAVAVVDFLRPVGLSAAVGVHGFLGVVPRGQLGPDEQTPNGQHRRQEDGQ